MTTAPDTLWEDLRLFFEEDEGYLPEIELNELSAEGLEAVWGYLWAHGERPPDQRVWVKRLERDVPLSEVKDPAAQVAAGEAESLSAWFNRLSLDVGDLPGIGALVFSDSIVLYYSPGNEWGPEEVRVLCELLRRIVGLAPGVRIAADQNYPPEHRMRFEDAVKKYANGAAGDVDEPYETIERQEAIAGIQRGLDDAERGRIIPAQEAFERLRRHLE